jgi:hypothetical protein
MARPERTAARLHNALAQQARYSLPHPSFAVPSVIRCPIRHSLSHPSFAGPDRRISVTIMTFFDADPGFKTRVGVDFGHYRYRGSTLFTDFSVERDIHYNFSYICKNGRRLLTERQVQIATES